MSLTWPPGVRNGDTGEVDQHVPVGVADTGAAGTGAAGTAEANVMELKMVLFLPRDAASVPLSRQVLTNCLETLGVTQDTRTDIALALSEACGNVTQHAGPGDEYEVRAG